MEIAENVDVAFPARPPAINGRPSLARYRKMAKNMASFDLILTYGWGAMDAAMAHRIFGKRFGLAPLIHHEDGFDGDEAFKRSRKRNMFRSIALKSSQTVIVPSKSLLRIAKDEWKIPQGKTMLIPNGVNIAAFRQVQRESREVTIGTLAGLRTVKNLPRLVRAVAAAGDSIRLVIFGEGPARAEIEAEAERLGITERVSLPGFATDPAHALSRINIFALSSDSEQMPIALIEAMASGLPVVATDVGDIRNTVAKQNARFVIPVHDELALADAIATLATDNKLCLMLGEANAQRAALEYDAQKMTARYWQTYFEALKDDRLN